MMLTLAGLSPSLLSHTYLTKRTVRELRARLAWASCNQEHIDAVIAFDRADPSRNYRRLSPGANELPWRQARASPERSGGRRGGREPRAARRTRC
jgi:hypothetical protein